MVGGVLTSRSALLLGLLFGFLWEELLPPLPGDVPRFTMIFYLRPPLSGELSTGPRSGFPKVVLLGATLVVFIGIGAVFVILGGRGAPVYRGGPRPGDRMNPLVF